MCGFTKYGSYTVSSKQHSVASIAIVARPTDRLRLLTQHNLEATVHDKAMVRHNAMTRRILALACQAGLSIACAAATYLLTRNLPAFKDTGSG